LLLSKKWFLKPASTEYFGGPSKKSTLFLSLVFIIPCLFRVFCYYYPWSFREEGHETAAEPIFLLQLE
jgi:hypothetical protein